MSCDEGKEGTNSGGSNAWWGTAYMNICKIIKEHTNKKIQGKRHRHYWSLIVVVPSHSGPYIRLYLSKYHLSSLKHLILISPKEYLGFNKEK
jgi:hypothetical protein